METIKRWNSNIASSSSLPNTKLFPPSLPLSIVKSGIPHPVSGRNCGHSPSTVSLKWPRFKTQRFTRFPASDLSKPGSPIPVGEQQDTRTPGHQNTRKPGHQNTRTPGLRDTKTQTNADQSQSNFADSYLGGNHSLRPIECPNAISGSLMTWKMTKTPLVSISPPPPIITVERPPHVISGSLMLCKSRLSETWGSFSGTTIPTQSRAFRATSQMLGRSSC